MEPFNPNKPALTKSYFWATYIPNRRPDFKLHLNRGHALNAFMYGREGILYQWDKANSWWIEITRVESKGKPKPTHCERCGGSDEMSYPRWRWVDKHTDAPRMLQICRTCDRLQR